MEPRNITWIPKSNGAHAKFAVHAGIDSGNKLYVARAQHSGGVIPGKLHIGHPNVYIPYNGQEISKSQYEVHHIGTAFDLFVTSGQDFFYLKNTSKNKAHI